MLIWMGLLEFYNIDIWNDFIIILNDDYIVDYRFCGV